LARLACRALGHGEPVVAELDDTQRDAVGLWCGRCGQRRSVPLLLRGAWPVDERPPAAGVSLVDRGALEDLWARLEVEASFSAAFRQSLVDEDGAP
jgi:hypothetical protein